MLSPVNADGTRTSYSPLLGGRLRVSRFNTVAEAGRGPPPEQSVVPRCARWLLVAPSDRHGPRRGLDCGGGGLSAERAGAGLAPLRRFLGPSSRASLLPVHHSTQEEKRDQNLRLLYTFVTLAFLSKPTNLSSGRITGGSSRLGPRVLRAAVACIVYHWGVKPTRVTGQLLLCPARPQDRALLHELMGVVGGRHLRPVTPSPLETEARPGQKQRNGGC